MTVIKYRGGGEREEVTEGRMSEGENREGKERTGREGKRSGRIGE